MARTCAACVWICFLLLQLDAFAGAALGRRIIGVAHGQALAVTEHGSGSSSVSTDHGVRGEDSGFVFEVPPPPAQAKPVYSFDVHTGFSAPLDNGSLCPSGAGCVLQSGGGVGATVERRWPLGLGVFFGYDIWFLDTDSVYELGVQQILRLGLRYTMPTSVVFHPVFELNPGVMFYGDTFQVATVGAALEALAGAEVELSAAWGLRAGLGVRVFSHSAFRTERDDVVRGKHGLLSESIFLQVGLTFQ